MEVESDARAEGTCRNPTSFPPECRSEDVSRRKRSGPQRVRHPSCLRFEPSSSEAMVEPAVPPGASSPQPSDPSGEDASQELAISRDCSSHDVASDALEESLLQLGIVASEECLTCRIEPSQSFVAARVLVNARWVPHLAASRRLQVREAVWMDGHF